MILGYIFDLNGIVSEETMTIPHLSGLYYRHLPPDDLNLPAIISFRDEITLKQTRAGQAIDKHIFFIVVKNNRETIQRLSVCLDAMQKDIIHFNQAHFEVHVLLNLIEDDGISIKEYEKMMPCLSNNAVCVYSWLLDKYDYSGGTPIIDIRRAHSIARLAWVICNHRGELSLKQMHVDRSPIHNLFGDSSVYFNENERDDAVRFFYYYKSIQHLLNLPDKPLDDYLKENVIPFRKNRNEMEKRLDASAPVFLLEQRVPIEASFITEKTQGLLIKSSDDDNEYLVNASDNKLVFIDDLSRKQQWQMEKTDNVIDDFWKRISQDKDHQETISDDFIKDVQDRVIVHKRTVFDSVNNEVSRSRRAHIDDFKNKVDKYLLGFLNGRDSQNYSSLSETLTPMDVQRHRSNIDCGIAFLEYLEAGKGEYLSDKEMSAGDINFNKIRSDIFYEEKKRHQELLAQEEEIKEFYKEGVDGQPSKAKAKFDAIDREIKKHKEDIRLQTYQLDHWYDADSIPKLTARTRATIHFASGIIMAGLWAFSYLRWFRPQFVKAFMALDPDAKLWSIFSSMKGVDKTAWTVFSLLMVVGFIIGFVILYSVVKKRKESLELLKKAKDKKKRLMRGCMDNMKVLVEKRYRHMLAFHGLKTISELIEFVKLKEEDLLSFRKMLFRLMVNYRLTSMVRAEPFPSDSNTIELNDVDVNRLLFGTEDNRKSVPFCFYRAGGLSLFEAFEDFKRKKVRLETTRFNPSFIPQEDFDAVALENEVIPCRDQDISDSLRYTVLDRTSVLPETEDIRINDVHQGQCGDCYFMATLASIAQMNPEYIIGQRGLIEPLGSDNRFFRVRFFDKDGKRVSVDIDNRFWNKNGHPIYAGVCKPENQEADFYDPWVMAVEKAWAKVNSGGYDGIEGASGDGQERVRKVEYSFAVTGKSAFYCMTKNVPDRGKLLDMMKKHILQDKLPITLYSASPSDLSFTNKDPYLVEYHAYSLKTIHEDGTFDIFNPWNNYMADEDVKGKHYERVNIDFIKDNFEVIVFFGIKETDFSSFERDLTGNASESDLADKIEGLMNEGLLNLDLDVHNMEDLMTDAVLARLDVDSSYLFNVTRVKDERGVNMDEARVIYIEPARDCAAANSKLKDYFIERGDATVVTLNSRSDDKQSLTVLRVSPPYVLSNFHDIRS